MEVNANADKSLINDNGKSRDNVMAITACKGRVRQEGKTMLSFFKTIMLFVNCQVLRSSATVYDAYTQLLDVRPL
jgi:hypothetical protein